MIHRFALMRALLIFGVLAVFSAGVSAQESDRGDSGDLTTRAAAATTMNAGESGVRGTKAVEPGVLQGDSGGPPRPEAGVSSDDTPSWRGKSVDGGLSDTQVVSRGKAAGDDGGDDAIAGSKAAIGGAGDDSGPPKSG